MSIEYAASATNAWRKTYSCSPRNLVSSRRLTISRTHSSSSQAVTCASLSSPASERDDAAAPERLPEDARGAEHAPRLGLERLEARLHHREHGLGQRHRREAVARSSVGARPRCAVGAGGPTRGGTPTHDIETERISSSR